MNDPPAAPRTASPSRLVRVFVSSTFRDMQAERDHLVKVIFPELRRRCRERAVEFVEVDLRWGVTEEQAERGETLPICLAEIERCRPYFIALLGERYGYVPKRIDPELERTQPWLAEHRSHSLTALEILHGAINNPQMAGRACFYFRDPGYLERLPPERRADFAAESPAAHARLEALKAQIRQSGLALKENYSGPETGGAWILADLWQAIDQEYPAGTEPYPLDREAAEHDAFAQSRARVYIGRQDDFDRLEAHVRSDGPPLVLLGESGVGKSALLANWARHYRQAHSGAFLFLHFIGSTPASADYVALLGRLLGELKRRFGLTEELPAAPEKLREALPLWLASAAAKGRLVLVLDALNQLEDRDHAPDLGWLPAYFPPNVRVILSTLPGRSLTALERRGWPTFEVRGLVPEERRQVIVEYLALYRKGLSEARLERIAATPQAANPLYLRTLLEELRVFGVHEALDARIAHYLTAATVPDLYDKVLERLEQDYEGDRPGLVRDALSLVWAARRGLYESELLELLGSPESPLPRAHWSPLYLALQESLVSRSGLLGFFHDYLRLAAHRRYLPGPEAERALHLRLADYFGARALDERQVEELPWQLKAAEAWARLEDCVTDLDRFLVLVGEARRYELMGYWRALEGQGHDVVAAYEAALGRYQAAAADTALALRMHQVAFFLTLNARYAAAVSVFRRALAIYEQVLGPEHPDTATTLSSLAWALEARGDYASAEPLCRRALAIRERVLGPEHPDMAYSLQNLAGLLDDKGDYASAETLCRRGLAIRERVFGEKHRVTIVNLIVLAQMLRHRGNFAAAEPLCRRALDVCEQVLGPLDPDTAAVLRVWGQIMEGKRRYAEAETLYRRTAALEEQMLGPQHPSTAQSLVDLAEVLGAQRRYDEAEVLQRRALAIREAVLGAGHQEIAESLNNLAVVLRHKKLYSVAETLHRRALAIDETALGPQHPFTAMCLLNVGSILSDQSRYDEAEPIIRQALAILEKALGSDHPAVVAGRSHLRLLLVRMHPIRTMAAGLFCACIAGGLAIGMWSPWLWFVGGPLVVFGILALILLPLLHRGKG